MSLPNIFGLPESLGMERTKKMAPREAVGHRMDAGQDAKKGNLGLREFADL
jgi:hypothetical protein